MSDDESRHDLPTEGGAIFAENGSETVEEDQTGSTFMDCSINSTDANSLRGTTGRSGQGQSGGNIINGQGVPRDKISDDNSTGSESTVARIDLHSAIIQSQYTRLVGVRCIRGKLRGPAKP